MLTIEEAVRGAKEAGMTYGEFVALPEAEQEKWLGYEICPDEEWLYIDTDKWEELWPQVSQGRSRRLMAQICGLLHWPYIHKAPPIERLYLIAKAERRKFAIGDPDGEIVEFNPYCFFDDYVSRLSDEKVKEITGKSKPKYFSRCMASKSCEAIARYHHILLIIDGRELLW